MTRPERTIEVEVEVAGTPEEVWDAIATGPGITAWFVPAEVGEHAGGTVSLDIGTGMQESGTVTSWDPPRRFAYEEEWKDAKLGTAFLVQTRGGTCVVRIVSSVFASGADWDRELEGMHEGWKLYLRNLQLYLTDFAGERCSTILVMGGSEASLARTWAELCDALGIAAAPAGDRVTATVPGGPALAGTVDRLVDDMDHHRTLLLRLDQPAHGIASIFAFAYDEQIHTLVHAYLFGTDGPAIVTRDEPAWRAWMSERFPLAEGAPRS